MKLARLLVLLPLLATATLCPSAIAGPTPPIAAKDPVETTHFGDTRVDEYAWLRQRGAPEVLAYLEAENAFTEALMAHTEPLQQTLYDEMIARLQQTDTTAPYRSGDFDYSTRTVTGKEYPIHVRRPADGGAEEIILDVNDLARDHGYFRVGRWRISPDGALVAYTADTTGAEEASIVVRDISSQTPLADRIEGASPWFLAWASDSRTVFYCRMDEANRVNRVFRHTLGADPASDVLVFEETDPQFHVSVRRTRSGELILIRSESSDTAEVRYIRAASPTDEPRLVRERRPGVDYRVDHRPGEGLGLFYLVTDDGAPDYKVCFTDVRNPSVWMTLAAEEPGVYRTGVACFRDHLVVAERTGGRTRLVHNRYVGGRPMEIVEPSVPIGTLRLRDNHDFDATAVRYAVGSAITPQQIWERDFEGGGERLRKARPCPGFDGDRYEVAGAYATADDGARIPISIAHRRDVKQSGENPCFIQVYGAYGVPNDPGFESDLVCLLDRGFVCAIAHVRGGSEMGRAWKDGGKLADKINTTTDLIAVADHLVTQRWTTPKKLVIEGGSAGGIPVGAAINMRPDLFAAAHAAVPFVDCLNTMLDASIPLTTEEYGEWGDPAEPEAYAAIKAYAPYENVREQDYPALLVTAGLNDPRVQYWEPAKWVARLRDRKTDGNPLLLRTNMGAGHGGASGRYGRLAERAFELAFLIDRVAADAKPR